MSLTKRHYIFIALAAIVLSALALFVALREKFPAVEGGMAQASPHPAFDELDPWVRNALLDDKRTVAERYDDLFRYFVAGYVAYRSKDGALAFYPGAASSHGRHADALEGFSRIAPLIAAWLHSGRPEVLDIPNFGEVNLGLLLRQGIEAGTDPASESYWGHIGVNDQRVIEAADIALAIWLARDSLWKPLNPVTRKRVVAWLAETEGKVTPVRPVNVRLDPMLVNRVLRALGAPASDEAFSSDWSFVKASYVGDGWFRDLKQEGIDYYNAWSFHYALYWLAEIDPRFETAFVDDARRRFVDFFRYFMTPNGLPIFGRSICYRTAAPTPLLIAARKDPDIIDPGEARRALDSVWRYFANRGALVSGTLSQGYCRPDMRIFDHYSGPASCLWGTRSLVVAFMNPPESRFWSLPERPLAVEQADFDITSPASGLRVVGNLATKSVVVHQLHAPAEEFALEPYTWTNELEEWVFRRPFRPKNYKAKFGGATYRSDAPFCGCPIGNTADAMGQRTP